MRSSTQPRSQGVSYAQHSMLLRRGEGNDGPSTGSGRAIHGKENPDTQNSNPKSKVDVRLHDELVIRGQHLQRSARGRHLPDKE